MHVPEMFSDHRMFMFLYALMEMAASVPNIICMAQITCEFVYYTLLHHQRIEEHKHSVVGKHFRDVHDLTPNNLIKNFKVTKKCRGKLECLIYEMLWIKNKRPKLNTQAVLFARNSLPE